MKHTSFLSPSILTGLIPISGSSISGSAISGSANSQELTIAKWDGAVQDAQRFAFIIRFTETSGINISEDNTFSVAPASSIQLPKAYP